MVDKTLLLAGHYLGSVWSLVETPTQIARIAYTFSLLGHIDKESSFFKLHSVRREGRRHVPTYIHKHIIIKFKICLAFCLIPDLKTYTRHLFSDNNIYWANKKIDPSPFYVIDTVTIMSPQKEIVHLGKP